VGTATAITWIAWILARALALVTLVLLAQTLPADDLGALLAAIAAGLLGATLAIGGLPDATTRSAASSAGEGAFGRGDLWSALARFGATLPFVIALLLLISEGGGGLDWELVTAGVLLAVTQGGTSILAAVFRARGQAVRFALATGLVVAVGRTIVAALAYGLDAGAGFVLWSFVALNAGMIVATWRPAVRGLAAKGSEREGAGALHLSGAVWALLAHLDVVVVGVVLGADAAGVYGASLRLAELSYQSVFAVSVVYLPEAVKMITAGQPDALAGLYRTASRWSTLVSLLLAGVGFVAAPWLSELLFADDAPDATTVMRILFVGYAVYGALGLGYLTSVALGSYREIRRVALVSLPTIVVATVAAAELWGLTGVACATATGYVGFNLYWLLATRRALGAMPFDRNYSRALIACALSVAVAGILALLVGDAPALIAILVLGAGGTVAWLGLIVPTGAVTPGELRRLRRHASPRGPTGIR
jgi:O-antigen/teichoic acid export membrane protein